MTGSAFLTTEEVSERYRGLITVGTLENWRTLRIGPSFMKVGKAVLYNAPRPHFCQRTSGGVFSSGRRCSRMRMGVSSERMLSSTASKLGGPPKIMPCMAR